MQMMFKVEIEPRGKDRGRAVMYNKKGGGAAVRVVTSEKTRAWEKEFKGLVRGLKPDEVLEGPLRVDILAIFSRPKYMEEVVKKTGKYKYPKGFMYKATKPDRDNVTKIVLDGMSEWWLDDAQVVSGETLKLWSEIGGQGRLYIRVTDELCSPVDWMKHINML